MTVAKKAKKSAVFSVRLTLDEEAALMAHARIAELPPAIIVRRALKDLLQKPEKKG